MCIGVCARSSAVHQCRPVARARTSVRIDCVWPVAVAVCIVLWLLCCDRDRQCYVAGLDGPSAGQCWPPGVRRREFFLGTNRKSDLGYIVVSAPFPFRRRQRRRRTRDVPRHCSCHAQLFGPESVRPPAAAGRPAAWSRRPTFPDGVAVSALPIPTARTTAQAARGPARPGTARPGSIHYFNNIQLSPAGEHTGAKCNRIVVIVVVAAADLDSGARKRVRARYEVIARKPTRPPDLGRCALGRGAMKQAIAPAHAAIAFLSR